MVEPKILPLSALLACDGLTAKNRIVFDYWQSLRRDGALPSRRDFDPVRLGPVLDRLCLFDVKPGEWLMCRLAGSAVCQVLGLELSGMDARDYTPAPYLEQRLACYHLILAGMAMRNSRATDTTAGRHVEWQDLTLPFADTKEDGSRQVLIMSDFGSFKYQERVAWLPATLGAPLKAEFIKL
jgi:hypothetical protein